MGNAFVPQLKNTASLAARGDFQFCLAVKSGHGYFNAQSRLGKVDRQLKSGAF
jgi:hypothetical protein